VDSAIDISAMIVDAPCPTIAYVQGQGALSAGALISYSCDEIILGKATGIGASAPVMMTGEDASETMDKKSKSVLRARYRALAEENGHNSLLGEAMVEADMELRAYVYANGEIEIQEIGSSEDRSSGSPALDDVLDTVREVLESETGKVVKQVLEELTGESSDEILDDAVSVFGEEEEPVILEDGSEQICARGELLTLSTHEALRYGMSPIAVDDLDDVLAYAGWGDARKVNIIPTWSESLFRFLTSPMVAGLLLLIGFGGIYIEIRTPGVGLPGLIGIIALTVFFGSHAVIGLAEWIDLLLVAAGLVLIVAEIFVIPGFGLAGLSGGACLVIGMYLSLTRVTFPRFTWEFQQLQDAGQTVCTATVLFVVFMLVTWKLFPKSPFARWLILEEAQLGPSGYVVQTTADVEAAIGRRGVTSSMLRPAGRGRFDDETWDIVTRGEFIEKDRPVEVIEVSGNRYVVAEIPEEEA
jgi:membrane-bound serine protease (ClpP class)